MNIVFGKNGSLVNDLKYRKVGRLEVEPFCG